MTSSSAFSPMAMLAMITLMAGLATISSVVVAATISSVAVTVTTTSMAMAFIPKVALLPPMRANTIGF